MLITGIDIGADTIKVAQVRRTSHTIQVVRLARYALGEAARLPAGESKNALIAKRLADLLREKRIRVSSAVTAITGRGTLLRYVPVPPIQPWKLEAFMKYEAQENSGEGENGYDYQLLDLPGLTDTMVALIGTAQESVLEERRMILADAGIQEIDYDLQPMALHAAYAWGQGASEDETALLVDLGAENTSIVIARGRRLLFARIEAFGGRRFTEVVMQEMGVDAPEAERLKRESDLLSDVQVNQDREPKDVDESSDAPAATSPAEPKEPSNEKVLNALQRCVGILYTMLQSSLTYCRTQTRLKELKIDRVVLTGGGANLKGLPELLGRRMRVPVVALEPFRQVTLTMPAREVEETAGVASDFSVALGVAISRAQPEAMKLSLITDRERRQKHFLEHRLYRMLAIGVAAVAMAIFVAAYVYSALSRKHYRVDMEQAVERAQHEKSKYAAQRAAYDDVDLKLQRTRSLVNSGHGLLQTLYKLRLWTEEEDICLMELTTWQPMKVAEDEKKAVDEAKREAEKRGTKLNLENEDTSPDAPWRNEGRLYMRLLIRAPEITRALAVAANYRKKLSENGQGFLDDVRILRQPFYTAAKSKEAEAEAKPQLFEFVIGLKLSRKARGEVYGDA